MTELRPRKLTGEQTLAVHPEATTWVTASAGTGKTHVLTARALRLMLEGAEPQRILCLTYTKAAATEMKERIFRELADWALLADNDLKDRIRARTGAKPTQDMLARARALFALVLELPGGLRIQTIHSFCHSLLARFPTEAGLPPRFTAMDERTADDRFAEAREEALSSLGKAAGGRFSQAVRHLALRVADKTFDQLMKEMAGARVKILSILRRYGGVDALAGALRERLGLPPGLHRDGLVADFLASRKAQKKALAGLAGTAAETGKKSDKDLAAAIHGVLSESAEEAALAYAGHFVTEDRETGEWRMKGRGVATQALTKNPGHDALIRDEAEAAAEFLTRLDLLGAAEDTEALLIVAGEILDRYRRAKDRDALLDYDDLIEITRRLMEQPDIAPWILYKLDGGIDHIMVDEAQDTNPVQWRFVDILSQEFFAGRGAGEAIRTVFAVGDVKQSIYSFQGADPQAFLDIRETILRRAEQAKQTQQSVPLDRSFRSGSAILEAVDAVFAQDEARDGLTGDDTPVHHELARKGQASLVELWPARQHPAEEKAEPWTLPQEQTRPPSAEALVAGDIVSHIEGLLKRGERLQARDRPVHPGDILILVQKRGPVVDALLRRLKARAIPVAGKDRMELTGELVVEDCLALADFVSLPDDDLSLAVVLKSPFFGLTDDNLMDLACTRKKGESLWARLNRDPFSKKWAGVLEILRDLLGRADYVTVHEFYAGLLGPMGMRRRFLARLGEEADDPLSELLDLALLYEAANPPSLQGFAHWMRSGGAEIRREAEQARNAVRIMTVHGAKGLQSPIVYLPDACRIPRPGGPERDSLLFLAGDQGDIPAWTAGKERGALYEAKQARAKKEMQEYRRLLYVAMTRAEDRLYIAGWDGKNGPEKRPEGCWYSLIEQGLKGLSPCREANGAHGPVLRLETAQTEAPKPDGKEQDSVETERRLPRWLEDLGPVPAGPAMGPALAASDGEHAPAPTDGDDPALVRGRLIHKLLQWPDTDALEARIEQAAAAWGAVLTDDLKAAVLKEVQAVLAHPQADEIFGPASLAEVPLAAERGDGDGIQVMRIDRLIVQADTIRIIDFKTDRTPPETPAAVPETYIRQMAGYAGAVRAAFPGKDVRAEIFWTASGQLMALDQG